MIYSVWNQGKSSYDYYEDASQQVSLNVEKPSHVVNRTLGSTVDQAAWPLPLAARTVGSGDAAVGRIATRKKLGGLGDDLATSPTVKAGLLIGAAYLIWKYVAKPGRRRRRS